MTNIINKINCHKCISLFVTHDPRRRWGCMYFGFKTNFMPSSEVRKITGTECAYFINKSNKNTSSAKIKVPSGRLA